MRSRFVTFITATVILGAICSISAQELPVPSTYCWPQPIVFPDFRHDPPAERRLHFVVKGENPNTVVIESIRLNEQLRPDMEDLTVDGDSIAFSCYFMKFLGASGLRPVTGDFEVPYTLEYDKTTGKHVTLIGNFHLDIYSSATQADLNLDGVVDLADVQFMAEYFFKRGPNCEDEARMDVDGNGQVDLKDLRELISNVGM